MSDCTNFKCDEQQILQFQDRLSRLIYNSDNYNSPVSVLYLPFYSPAAVPMPIECKSNVKYQ